MHASRALATTRSCVILIAAFLGTLAAPLVRAQQFSSNNEFGVWAAYSANSPDVYTSQGHIQFGVAGFRYGRVLRKARSYTLEYTVDVEPVEVSRANVYESWRFFIMASCSPVPAPSANSGFMLAG